MSFLEGIRNRQELFRRIDLIYLLSPETPPSSSLHCVLLIGKSPLNELERVTTVDPRFSAKVEKISADLYRLDYSRNWQGSIFEDSAFFINFGEDAWVALSNAENIMPFYGILWRMHPRFWQPYLRSQDFLHLLDLQNRQVNAQLDIYLGVIKRGIQSDVIYNPRSLKKLQDHVDAGHFIKSIKYRLYEFAEDQGRIVFDCKLTRNGIFDFNLGHFSLFNKLVLQPLLEMSKVRYNFYSKRDREVIEGQVRLKPVIIEFDEPIESPDIQFLKESLREIPRLSVSIVHAGNPFFLAHLVDRVDGSLIDIAASGKSIYITPTARASPASLLRVLEPVLIRTREGVLRDYHGGETEPTIQEPL